MPPQTASTLRITLLGREGSGVVRIAEVGFGGARIRPDAQRAATACIRVADIDGRALEVRPVGAITSLTPLLFQGCDPEGLTLSSGPHEVSSVPGWTLDTIVLRDRTGETVRPAGAGPRLRVSSSRPTSYDIRAAATDRPWTLVLGQAYDARWHAEEDGRDLGAPEVVDGYSAGWTIDPGSARRIIVRYGTQRPADLALGLSAAGALVSAALVVLPGRGGAGPPATPWVAVPVAEGRSLRRRRRIGWVAVVAAAGLTGGWWWRWWRRCSRAGTWCARRDLGTSC